MDYTQINNRLRTIRKEIHELRQQSVVDIQEKINVLKQINILLSEQNQLLSSRQNLLQSMTYAA